ncbi:response regulator transcription factor [Massilia sp. CCM 8734]|uniref:LuxR C-terminal-related transcriptional regulator n=1 Tax=Massilia sp. CCM 8734 TaxID=2609283 RepID=UPI0014237791|nr:response regulator transcription factor [Massilia sp. CCM 8734]NHZ99503.1 response regulator [Massilia sp. CCM 8734]
MPIKVAIIEHCAMLRTAQRLVLLAAPDIALAGEFADGASALAWLQRAAPDVLIVDIDLPERGALDIIELCARLHPRCGILALSALCDEASVYDCIDAGASGFLCGRRALPDLGAAVLELHAGGSPISPEIGRKIIERARLERPRQAKAAGGPGQPKLTRRETIILELVARGSSDKEVAKLLEISFRTVQTHVKNILNKLFASSRTEAVFEARRQGLLRM